MSNTQQPPGGMHVKGERRIDIYTSRPTEYFSFDVNGLRLRLREYEASVKARRGWAAPAGMLATLVVSLATSTFADVLVRDTFVGAAVFFGFLTLRSLWPLVTVGRVSEDEIIDRLRNDSERHRGTVTENMQDGSSDPSA